MTDREQAQVLLRANEAGAFEDLGTRWSSSPDGPPFDKMRFRLTVEREALRCVEQLLGEELKAETFHKLENLFWGSRNAAPTTLRDGLFAAEEAFRRRREDRLRARAHLRRKRRLRRRREAR